MLARINLEYGVSNIIKQFDRDKYEKFRLTTDDFLELPEWKEDALEQPSHYIYGKKIIDLSTHGQLLTSYGIKFEVVNFQKSYMLNRPAAGPDETHSHIHIAVPNIGLLMIDEVHWLDDACTQELQRYLDDGWRILAVCPPNGVRRPDYILGRTKT